MAVLIQTRRRPVRTGRVRGVTRARVGNWVPARWWTIALAWELCLLVAVLLTMAFHMTGLIIGAVLVLLVLAASIPIAGRSLAGRGLDWFGFTRRQRPLRAPKSDLPSEIAPLSRWIPGLTVVSTRSAQGDEVGVLSDGSTWVGVLGLSSDDLLIADQGQKIDLDGLNGLTVQDDIVFAGIQLLTYTAPAPATVLLPNGSPLGEAYLEVDDQTPAIRMTWIAVRLDPRRCLEAIGRRGHDTEGIYATLRFGMHRVQQALKRQGITTRTLTAQEVYDVAGLIGGSAPSAEVGEVTVAERSRESWRTLRLDSLVHQSATINRFGPNKTLGFQAIQSTLTCIPALYAVSSYSLDSSSHVTGSVRLVAPTTDLATEAHEFLCARLPRTVKMAPAAGMQAPSFLATMPLGRGLR